MEITKEFNRWLSKATQDIDLQKELKSMNEEDKLDAFYKDLEFGTGGLRGIIGAGTNRLNVYTVSKATQGLANYINENFKREDRKVAISRDSRIKSDVFANVAASVLAANGIKVYIYPRIEPVPALSFATRYLKCCSGIMITASHNPSKYNGYKVYGSDGCQITTEAAKEILSYISKIDVFDGYKSMNLDDAFEKGLVEYIKPIVLTKFIEEVKKQSFLGDEKIDKNIAIVYSPLYGSGLEPVKRALTELGYTNVNIVKDQEMPNGYFPTCPYPNPEIKEALKVGLEYCKQYDADLMLATDPDCDRVGIAIKNKNGEHVLLTGNQVGVLLLDYICSRRVALKKMPKNPLLIKTIVSTDLADRVAANYGVQTINVLTGFKFIGEQIKLLENKNEADRYIFGFEESYGYLSGTYVRDKDAVNGSVLICEMFAYYKSKGLSLLDKLDEIFKKYGYCLNQTQSYEYSGPSGQDKMKSIMDLYRKGVDSFAGLKVLECQDYSLGLNGLPKSNVLKFILENNCSVVLRPSGTEPKLKVYTSISANDETSAKIKVKEILEEFENKTR